jgi:uroporphyrinogen-III decarboxylase
VIQTNGTDFGTQNGPFISPDQYRDMYLPYQRRLHDWIHENTPWKAFMHSCGGIYPLLDCVVDAGFDILNPVQCSAADMEPERLKKEYGDKLVFWGGGVDTQKTLPFGTPDEVREEVKRRIEVLGEGGGFVFCSIHNVVANVPIDNLLAMFEVVKEYR